MEKKYFYTTEVEWTGERHGDLRAPVLPDMEVDAPPEFKGHDGVWTPEHLFVAAVNSCFMTTFLAIAENSKLEFVSGRNPTLPPTALPLLFPTYPSYSN